MKFNTKMTGALLLFVFPAPHDEVRVARRGNSGIPKSTVS
jgi:hypothetical protein